MRSVQVKLSGNSNKFLITNWQKLYNFLIACVSQWRGYLKIWLTCIFNTTKVFWLVVQMLWQWLQCFTIHIYHTSCMHLQYFKQIYNIARLLALFKSYWAVMNKIFIYARPCVYKMTPAFFLTGCKVSILLSCSAVFPFFKTWKKPAKNCPIFLSA